MLKCSEEDVLPYAPATALSNSKRMQIDYVLCFYLLCIHLHRHTDTRTSIRSHLPTPTPPVKVHKAPLKSNGRSLPITPPEPTSILASFHAPRLISRTHPPPCVTPPLPAKPSPLLPHPVNSSREWWLYSKFLGGREGKGAGAVFMPS